MALKHLTVMVFLDTTNAEIDFTSSDEAGNFAELVNNFIHQSW